ncbi:hypothetical protein B5X24_HaOG205942 [Helicoverpa armigera]|uniref:Scavenger receptor class B member 1 n=1 Tax=Helicoverpa armigera TaxID=29058 RepID=A0A2W1BV01_HELAM|nr:hypothetical protein B5X24_HaOG205942 [Helicoverpa armigera]
MTAKFLQFYVPSEHNIVVILLSSSTLLSAVISQSMVIRNNSLAYKIWRRPDVQPLMKVYLFNYTNWEQVKDRNEEKLKVEEVGPYVYS